jgi:uncharacterized protein
MMLIPTKVAPSFIHGVGMFTVEPVRAGTLLWEFTFGFDRSFSQESFSNLPHLARRYIQRHGFFTAGGLWVISGDDDQYVNHHANANMIESDQPFSVTAALIAARDIEAEEELTQNYMEWDALIAVKNLAGK